MSSVVSGFRRAGAGRKRARVAATERDRRRRPDERRHLRRRPPPGPGQQSGRLIDGAQLREQQGRSGEQTRLVGDGARGAFGIGARPGSVSGSTLALRPREQARRFNRRRPPGPRADRRPVRRRTSVARGQLDLIHQKLGARIAGRIGDRAVEKRARPADVAEIEENLGPCHPGREKGRRDDAGRVERPRGPFENRRPWRGPGRARRAGKGPRARRRPPRPRCALRPPGRRFGR